MTFSFLCHRCGNVAAILELDEHLQKEFIIFEAAPQETRGIPSKKPVADYFLWASCVLRMQALSTGSGALCVLVFLFPFPCPTVLIVLFFSFFFLCNIPFVFYSFHPLSHSFTLPSRHTLALYSHPLLWNLLLSDSFYAVDEDVYYVCEEQ